MTDRVSSKVSFSGRMANFMSRRTPNLGKRLSRMQAKQFEESAGKRGSKVRGKPIFRLTVVGRKTGEPRSVMLMLVRRGDDLLVCGSQGGTPDAPNWWKNLEAAGKASVQVGADTWDVDVHVVTDPAERAETWALLTAAYPDFASYQALTERVLPIAVLARSGASTT